VAFWLAAALLTPPPVTAQQHAGLQTEVFLPLYGEISDTGPSRRDSEAENYETSPKIPDQGITADLKSVAVGFSILARYPYNAIEPDSGVGVGVITGFPKPGQAREPTTIALAGNPLAFESEAQSFRYDEDASAGLQLIGSLRGFLSDHVALFGEYKYVKADSAFQSVAPEYEVNYIYGGIEYYFGPGVKKLAFGPLPERWPGAEVEASRYSSVPVGYPSPGPAGPRHAPPGKTRERPDPPGKGGGRGGRKKGKAAK
jgi:hypothetical protein